MTLAISPVHKSLQSFGSTSTHSTSYSPYQNSAKGLRSMTSFDSDSTHTTTRSSGWEYYGDLFVILTKSWDETLIPVDSLAARITKFWDESLAPFEGASLGRPLATEPINILDETLIKKILQFEETLTPADTTTSTEGFESTIDILDQWLVIKKVLATETLSPTDSGTDAFAATDFTDTVLIQVQGIQDVVDTVVIENSGAIDVTDSVNIGVVPVSLVGVTSPSGTVIATPLNPINLDPYDPSPTEIPVPGLVSLATSINPFEPTIIVDGVVYSYYSSTAPDTYDSDTNFIVWKDYDIEEAP